MTLTELLTEAQKLSPLAIPISLPAEPIVAFCQRWQITQLSLFGSILRPDFNPQSDIDFLVSFAENSPWSLLDMVQMQQELEQICQRKVDLVSQAAIDRSHNPIRRQEILSTAQVLYPSLPNP